jgi:hypothetical protein
MLKLAGEHFPQRGGWLVVEFRKELMVIGDGVPADGMTPDDVVIV